MLRFLRKIGIITSEVILLQILDIISAVLGVLMGAYGLFYAFIAIVGLKKRKSDFQKTAPPSALRRSLPPEMKRASSVSSWKAL